MSAADEVAAMTPDEVAERIQWARAATPEQIVERQKRERRDRAEQAAARFVRGGES